MSIRRARDAGNRYFFTVVTQHRQPLLIQEIDRLRSATRRVIEKRPFSVEAMVVLPDHLHAMWWLPEADTDFSQRWALLKRLFSSGLDACPREGSQVKKREKGIWQRRFWDHAVRDDEDWRRHVDYIHYNPVKHGYCSAPAEWPYSSFGRYVQRGWYPVDWGCSEPGELAVVAAEEGLEGPR